MFLMQWKLPDVWHPTVSQNPNRFVCSTGRTFSGSPILITFVLPYLQAEHSTFLPCLVCAPSPIRGINNMHHNKRVSSTVRSLCRYCTVYGYRAVAVPRRSLIVGVCFRARGVLNVTRHAFFYNYNYHRRCPLKNTVLYISVIYYIPYTA
jgi:hypothetical protein